MSLKPAVPKGIYVPSVTFFTNDSKQDVDYEEQAKHLRFLFDAGVHGIVLHGTTGESVLLSHEERNAITALAVKIREEARRPRVPLVVGCSAQSTREVLKMCRDAKENGGDYALVLPPSYWVKAVTPTVIKNFYCEVADAAPLPVIIYSFPGVTSGVDMDSDLLGELGEHPNIAGVKLTCGNAGKLTRLTSLFSPSEFSVFGGSTEWLLPGLIGKSCGAVTGLANTHPRACVELFELFQAGRLKEAVELQGIVSRAEWGMGNTGMSGTKYAVELINGHTTKVLPRRPLMEVGPTTKQWIRQTMEPLTVIEKTLAKA